jgi:hypothetical protein
VTGLSPAGALPLRAARLCDLSARSAFRHRPGPDPIVSEETESGMEPHRTPPLPAASAFAVTLILRLRSCSLMGVVIMPPLPPMSSEDCRTAGPLRSAGVTPPLRYYGPIRHPLAIRPLPRVAGYRADPFRRFRGGTRKVSPVALMHPGHRAVAPSPAGARRRVSQTATAHVAFAE